MSQDRKILDYLKQGHSLTPLEALKIFGTMRLGSRINDLRKEGHPIKTTIIKDGEKHYASYTIEETERVESCNSVPAMASMSGELGENSLLRPDELWPNGGC